MLEKRLGKIDFAEFLRRSFDILKGGHMKRIYVGTLLCIILSLGLLTGCDQGVARSLGGDMTLELEPGQKLEMITWKEDSLWYLTRPMRDDEEPETHTFQQSSEFGVFEGTVTIIESVVEGENAS